MSVLALAGLVAAGSQIIKIKPVAPAEAAVESIIFATVTPAASTALVESQPDSPAVTVANSETAPEIFAGANELGQIMMLEYHRLGYPETRYQRTPDNFRADLRRLHAGGYYPVNFIDLLDGLKDVPAGKKPIVLTFDDSDISQFRMLDDNVIDGDSAVGILLNFYNEHPQDWPLKATFFVLGDDTGNYLSVFGQPKWAKAKAKFLVNQGMEIGSHTVNHTDLSVATSERIYWELAISKHVIEEMVPGYTVRTLCVPYGGFPYTDEFLKAGEWGDYSYEYAGNAAAWGGPTVSPFADTFDPYHVNRVEVTAESFDHWLSHFEQNPQEYYVSDGNPAVITVPKQAIAEE